MAYLTKIAKSHMTRLSQILFQFVLLFFSASCNRASALSAAVPPSHRRAQDYLTGALRITSQPFSFSLFASVSAPDPPDEGDVQREYVRARRMRGRKNYYDGDVSEYNNDNNVSDEGDDGGIYDAEEENEYTYDHVDDEEYSLFGSSVIPNPLLDSIDPDGAADRFPELVRDPKFWFDLLLFVAFLDFLSCVGPQEHVSVVRWS